MTDIMQAFSNCVELIDAVLKQESRQLSLRHTPTRCQTLSSWLYMIKTDLVTRLAVNFVKGRDVLNLQTYDWIYHGITRKPS